MDFLYLVSALLYENNNKTQDVMDIFSYQNVANINKALSPLEGGGLQKVQRFQKVSYLSG